MGRSFAISRCHMFFPYVLLIMPDEQVIPVFKLDDVCLQGAGEFQRQIFSFFGVDGKECQRIAADDPFLVGSNISQNVLTHVDLQTALS